MAEILDKDMSVVMGNCIHVVNCEKKDDARYAAEDDVLICIQVENESGREEYPILMTQDEFDKLEKGYLPDMDDMVMGRIYPKFITDKNFYCVKLKENTNDIYVGIFDIGDWSTYYRRAIDHPKSVTHKSMITDLFD